MFGFPSRLPRGFAKVQEFHLNRRDRQSVRLAGDSINRHAQSSDQNGEGMVGHVPLSSVIVTSAGGVVWG